MNSPESGDRSTVRHQTPNSSERSTFELTQAEHS